MDTKETKDFTGIKEKSQTARSKRDGKRKGKRGKEKTSNAKIAYNSPEFWNKIPGLVGAAGRIPSTTPFVTEAAGYGSKFYDITNNGQQNQVFAISWMPTVGRAVGDLSDPINTAAQQLFTYVRQAITGARTYEAADLIQYIVAVYNAVLCLEWMKTIYGSTNIVSPLNRDIARVIIESFGYNYDDIVGHKADLLFFINNYVNKLTQFPIPGGWSCLEHWKLLLSGIFTDRYVNSMKNQFYVFCPRYFYKYDWANAKLDLVALPETGDRDNFTQLMTVANTIINSLTNNSDIQQIGADILRVFPDTCEKYSDIPFDYTIKVNITSNEMINQIRNLEFFTMDDIDDFALHQNGSSTLCYQTSFNGKPHLILSTSGLALNNPQNILNLRYGKGKALIGYEPNMSPEAIMVASRMQVHYSFHFDAGAATRITAVLESWGVELFLCVDFVKTSGSSFTFFKWDTTYITGNSASVAFSLEAARSEFDGAPKLIWLQTQAGTGGHQDVVGSKDCYDLDNFLLLPNEILDDLHTAAIQSAFYVPLKSVKLI